MLLFLATRLGAPAPASAVLGSELPSTATCPMSLPWILGVAAHGHARAEDAPALCSPGTGQVIRALDEKRCDKETCVSECIICGSTTNLTVEHIIPQALWKRFGVDPNATSGDVPKTRTTLCSPCNSATAALHNRTDMMALIETGSPTNKKTLQHLADWAFWVLLLLGLARGNGVVPADDARALLRARFVDRTAPSVPRGVRVYAGVATTLEPSSPTATTSFSVARIDDPSVLRDHAGEAMGMSARFGQPLQATQSIGIGKVVLLVLGPTQFSGAGHEARLDLAAATVGLTPIHPLQDPIPELVPSEYDLEAIRDLFVSVPFGTDDSLLPMRLQGLIRAFQVDL